MEIDKKTREELFQELEGKKYVIRKKAKLGVNQGQLFVRIPQKISNEFGLTESSIVQFILTKSKRKKTLELMKYEGKD